MHVDED
jgi:hypothetical protein